MRMQVILDSSFARPGSAPIWGGKKGEFRDWTNVLASRQPRSQGLSSYLSSLAPGGGKMRDPGNEVGEQAFVTTR